MDFSAGVFSVKVFNEISPTKDAWDVFHTGLLQMKASSLSALESSQPADMEFRYMLIYKGELVVACAYLQLVKYSEKNFSDNGKPWIVIPLKLLFRMKKVRLLFCGNLFSVDLPYLHFREEHIRFEEVLATIQKISALEKCQLLMLKEMNLSRDKLITMEQNGFRKYGEDMTMKLDLKISWISFEDYFDSLTRKYRKRLKLIRQSKEAIEVRTLGTDELDRLLPRIGELFRMTASRQFLKMGIIDEKYFMAMHKAHGENFIIKGYFKSEKLIAFASHFNHPDTLEVHYIGIDYAYNETFFLYFNILYDGVEMAISMKKRFLELGRTAREAKASVGCVPTPSFDYLFVSNRFINFLLSVFERLFLDKMGDEWKNRNPFKPNAQQE